MTAEGACAATACAGRGLLVMLRPPARPPRPRFGDTVGGLLNATFGERRYAGAGITHCLLACALAGSCSPARPMRAVAKGWRGEAPAQRAAQEGRVAKRSRRLQLPARRSAHNCAATPAPPSVSYPPPPCPAAPPPPACRQAMWLSSSWLLPPSPRGSSWSWPPRCWGASSPTCSSCWVRCATLRCAAHVSPLPVRPLAGLQQPLDPQQLARPPPEPGLALVSTALI